MRKSRLLGAALACASSFISIPASAASYSITYYENIGAGLNLFNDYQVSGTATFEIDDSAVFANNDVLFSDSEFLTFNATMNTTLGSTDLILGQHDFPPVDGSSINTHVQGILFDASGQPLRFDNPNTMFGNNALICNPSCDLPQRSRDTLILWDDNNFDSVYLADGTITDSATAIANGDAFTPLNGEWNMLFGDGASAVATDIGYYQIQAIPVPAAIWLFGSGLLGLVGIARRKKAA